METTLRTIERWIPRPLYTLFQPAYHYMLAFISAAIYRFPSRHIKVIAVTGTKGKSSTVELVNAMLEAAGYKTALSNTIRFKVGPDSRENLYKMSMPGRFFVQRLIREAVDAGCDYIVMEMTSQGALFYRHRFIDIDALVMTNISPEHIEAHGSYEKYLDAKLSIARSVSHSHKKDTAIIANADDAEGQKFLDCAADRKFAYGIKYAEPYEIKKEGISCTLNGMRIDSPLSGLFNLYNILAAATAAQSQSVDTTTIKKAIESFSDIPGRVQKIFAQTNGAEKQDFDVVVDYAHTADSLEKFYKVFAGRRNICILGGTGGGRDAWKRSEMGRIADENCAEIILTDEDPYDEDPNKIVADVAAGIRTKKPTIIMDRRMAIREALRLAKPGDAVLITGKGTDPYIMGPRGTKTPWSDAKVAQEELESLLENQPRR